MNLSITSKLPNVGTTIFTTMSALAVEYNAINLGQGFPDFMMNSALIELVNNAMKTGKNQYVHMNGLPILRERIAQKIESLYNTTIDAEAEITITPGGTYAIYTALTTILQPGDEVIVFEPAYDSYIPNIEINGAKPILIPLTFPDYSIDWDLVQSKITAKTRMILLNSPHNPSGRVIDKTDIEKLSAIVKDTNIFILSDEVYEHLIFDNLQHESILRYPELFQRSFVCFSFGKTYHCTGWKLGYCISPSSMMKEFRKVHQFNCFTSNSPIQFALSEFILQKDQYLNLGKEIQAKRDFFQTSMQQTKFTPLKTQGSYFQLYRYDSISDQNDNDFAIRLIKECGVVTIPVSAFYKNSTDNKVVRFCFVKKDETLEKAIERLIKL